MANHTIMVIDDQTLNLQLLKSVLSEYNVVLVKDGKEALKRLEEESLPDLILLDIVMPDMDGFEVIKRIKDNDKTMNIPVIFITGLNSAENEEEGLNLGAVDYIVKPFNAATVRARVRNTLKFRSQQLLLENMAHIDGLTEIPNRRNFNTTLDREFKNAFRYQRPLALIMIDVDHFKHYNDHYGHAKGDEALIQIAKTMQTCLNRPYDFVARYGGEEFAVILPETDEVGGKEVAENLRQAIYKLQIQHRKPNGQPWLTISLGGYSLIPEADQDPLNLIEKADASLYKAKRNGRNRVGWE